MSKPTKAQAIERLRRALDAIPALERLDGTDSSFEKWRRNTKIAITHTFEDEPDHIQEFNDIDYFPFYNYKLPPHKKRDIYLRGLKSAAAVLESMIDEVKNYWLEEDNQPSPSSAPEQDEHPNTKEVFVIHGRDDAARQTVARFIEKLNLTPVILHEQPNQGRTIIEKFEQHAQVGFAVALLTPDDVGALRGSNGFKPRARQNVVFELGYFLGRLGRNRVCALVKGEDLERPSDYDGVVYIPLDHYGGWREKLLKELRNAGLEIDANRMVE